GNCTDLGPDIRHIANATGLYQMKHFQNPWVQRFAGNWRISGILRANNGTYFDVVNGSDHALIARDGPRQRADQVMSNPYSNQCTNDLLASGDSCYYVNRNAFALAPLGKLGNSMIEAVKGPGAWTVDAGLSRIFNIGENQHMEFQTETSNVLNHANFN